MGEGRGALPPDAELWSRAIGGEPEAFGELFDRHAQAILSYCARRSGDRTAAEDLMSATFLHAWRRRTDVRPVADSLLPWLYGIAANLTRRHLRGLGRRQAAMARLPGPDAQPDPADDIVGRVDDARRVARVRAVLRALPERDQDLFVLCVWQRLSYEEAAAALDVPIGTVRSGLSRARTRLRSALGEPTPVSGDEQDEPHQPSRREERRA